MLLLIIMAFSMQFGMAQNNELRDFRWKNRLVIIHAGPTGQPQLKEQLQNIAQEITAYEERDLKIIILQNNKAWVWSAGEKQALDFQEIVKTLSIDLSVAYQNFLIGKDGGVKMKQNSAFSNQELFDSIDSMPMRRQEMRNKNK